MPQHPSRKVTGRARGGYARAAILSPGRRQAIARRAALARHAKLTTEERRTLGRTLSRARWARYRARHHN
jgi:hypothetical protein